MSDEDWLDVAAAILDDSEISWDSLTAEGAADDPQQIAALRIIADVARAHRTDRWGPFELLERVGHGTFGEVYRARDTALDREVALKLLAHTPAPATLEEGKLLARVRHPNVVTVHGAGIHDGRYGIWMEFVPGSTLGAIVEDHGPLPWRDVATIGKSVCAALTAVHNAGLLHGDVKARNVMREDGGRIVLMDFGTGRLAGDPSGRLSGTPLYIAPEVLAGASPDVRSDIYSTGVLLHYLLAGEHPVEGASLDAVRAAHDRGERRPVRERQRRCPRALAAIVDQAISQDPDRRFQRAEAFESALNRFMGRRAAVQRAALFTMGTVVFALAGIGAYTWIPSRSIPRTSGRGSNVSGRRARSAQDLAGTWGDVWTQVVCGYTCGTQPGGTGTSTLTVTGDSPTRFHGKFGPLPIDGAVKDGSITFRWQNAPTWAGMAEGSCQGTIAGTSMLLTCAQWIQSPSSGLLLNSMSTDKLTKQTEANVAITVVDERSERHGLHSLPVHIQYMNAGGTRSGATSADLFLSRSGVTRDIFLRSLTLGALDPYQIAELSTVAQTDSIAAGQYFLLACVGMDCRRSVAPLALTGSRSSTAHTAK